MPTAVETAVQTYIRAWSEPDAGVRATLLEACFAEDGRVVMPGHELRGRAALAEAMTSLLTDPEHIRLRVTSVVDARATIFRFRVLAERRDGTARESFDAGEIDESGRISLILAFGGPLADAPDSAR